MSMNQFTFTETELIFYSRKTSTDKKENVYHSLAIRETQLMCSIKL